MRMVSKLLEERKIYENTRILYMFKNLDRETVCNFKDYIGSFEDYALEFNLTVINRTDYPKRGVLTQFDNVKFVEND